MDKRELAILKALAATPAGLLQADMREATGREVSRHTVHEQLQALLAREEISAAEEQSADRRVKKPVVRFRITEKGAAAMVVTPSLGNQ